MTDDADDQLDEARALRDRLLRGDAMIGLLPIESIDELVAAYTAAGEGGHAVAWRELGQCYRHGIGVAQDDAAAAALWERAIAAGDHEATFEWIALQLYVLKTEPALARARAEALAADGTPRALRLLGYLHHHGFGGPVDPAAALALHRRAAEGGDLDAMFELSVLYATGQGAAVDAEASLRWCVRAAEAGHPRAAYNLGAFHATGRGVPQDWSAAVRWYERAARAGSGRAAETLAVMYATGDGVPADPEQALVWQDVAESLGFG